MTELRMEAVDAGYGPIPVLSEIELSAHGGEVVALLGRNGAGKTTLLRTAMGMMTRVYQGVIRLDGRDVTGGPTYARARAGMQFVPEDRGIFNALTVRQNLELGSRTARRRLRGGSRLHLGGVLDRFPILGERLDHRAAVLSGGERQILAIARALLTDARVLLLDEFSEGLQPTMVRDLSGALRELQGDDCTIVMVEQDAAFAAAFSDRVYVLEKGRIVDKGDAAAFRANEERLQAHLTM